MGRIILTLLLLGCGFSRQAPATPLLYLTGDVSTATASGLHVNLRAHPEGAVVVISSPGGKVADAEAIIADLGANPRIWCVGVEAMSAAFWIFEACPHRILLESSQLMTHEAFYDFSDGVPADMLVLTPAKLRVLALELEAITTRMATTQALRMGVTVPDMLNLMHWSWTPPAREAFIFGAADALVADLPAALTYIQRESRKE